MATAPSAGAHRQPSRAAGTAAKARFATAGTARPAGPAVSQYQLEVMLRHAITREIAAQRRADAREAAERRADARAASQPGPAPAPAPAGAGYFSFAALENLWVRAGGPSWAAAQAASIALCESNGNPAAYNPSGASGLWQILGQVVPGDLFDPLVNAENAVAKFRASGDTFAQWVC